MANSTEEYWSINGISLHQYGWNVATVGGSRYDLPTRRGDNLILARRPGALHRRKPAESRTINLIMWVTGTEPGTGASVPDPRTRFNDSWDYLRRLVWQPGGGQVDLTRRWRLTVGEVSQIVTAAARAEIADSMSPAMTGRLRADFTMTLLLADPYFYGDTVETQLNVGATATVSNPGHDTAMQTNLGVDFIGPLTNPRLTLLGADPMLGDATGTDVWVAYNGTIAAGYTLRLDVGAFTVTKMLTSGNMPVSNVGEIGKISHSGSRHWMLLPPGANSVRLTGTGTGKALVRFAPPYI